MSTPKITPKPLPRITPNTSYAEDGSPLTRFEVEADTDVFPSVAKALEMNATVSTRPLHGGRLVAIGDVY